MAEQLTSGAVTYTDQKGATGGPLLVEAKMEKIVTATDYVMKSEAGKFYRISGLQSHFELTQTTEIMLNALSVELVHGRVICPTFSAEDFVIMQYPSGITIPDDIVNINESSGGGSTKTGWELRSFTMTAPYSPLENTCGATQLGIGPWIGGTPIAAQGTVQLVTKTLINRAAYQYEELVDPVTLPDAGDM